MFQCSSSWLESRYSPSNWRNGDSASGGQWESPLLAPFSCLCRELWASCTRWGVSGAHWLHRHRGVHPTAPWTVVYSTTPLQDLCSELLVNKYAKGQLLKILDFSILFFLTRGGSRALPAPTKFCELWFYYILIFTLQISRQFPCIKFHLMGPPKWNVWIRHYKLFIISTIYVNMWTK